MNDAIPRGYEKIVNQEQLSIHHPEEKVVISMHERDLLHKQVRGEYKFRVIGSHDQETFFDGSFKSEEEAEEKIVELAKKHPK